MTTRLRTKRSRAAAIAILIALAVSLKLLSYEFSVGMRGRVANTTASFPRGSPTAGAWELVPILPEEAGYRPIDVITTPAHPDDVFLVAHDGTIHRRPVEASGDGRELFLDIQDAVRRKSEAGLVGLAFHPGYGQPGSANRGYFYVFYNALLEDGMSNRLSRFTVPDGARVADRASELVLIEQRDRHNWHNAGCLKFGPDGFLYIGVGDEGGKDDVNENGQRIDKNLFSGILRIDVDRRGGGVSHSPPRQPADGTTAHYFIPDDNPFVGVENALEEFYAIGLRNPHRIAFDPATGVLWCGDVGASTVEEINHIVPGGNYGWSYLEGDQRFVKGPTEGVPPAGLIGTEQAPFYQYLHALSDVCIIGGFVIRGSKFPELEGRYIFGDRGSGRIWTLVGNTLGVYDREAFGQTPQGSADVLASFAQDLHGNLYVVGYSSTIYRVERADPSERVEPPQTLARTGLFEDLSDLRPRPGVIPYEINHPAWSDGAHARRWIMLPGDGTADRADSDRIGFYAERDWFFPVGTVFVQHLELALDARSPDERTPIETRVLVRDESSGVYGLSYRWNDEGTDAELVGADGFEAEIPSVGADGSEGTRAWYFPGPGDCVQCHNSASGYARGMNVRQLNRDIDYGDGSRNQLRSWFRAGLIDHDQEPLYQWLRLQFSGYDRLPRPTDASVSVAARTRAYLEANCSGCHRPLASQSAFDARWIVPLEEKGLIGVEGISSRAKDGQLLVTPGDPDGSLLYRLLHSAEMPPLPRLAVDEEGARAVAEWIESLSED